MLVKINGIPFNPESVLRFAPRKKGRMKFEPDDICTLSMMAAQADYVEKCGFKTSDRWTRWVGGLCLERRVWQHVPAASGTRLSGEAGIHAG